MNAKNNKIDIFENKPIPSALATMAITTIMSQFSLVATAFLMTVAVSNLFGVGGGSLVVRLQILGASDF